jgi:hypothetical protein
MRDPITSDDIENRFVNNRLDGSLSFHMKGVPSMRGIPLSGFSAPELDYHSNMTVDFHLEFYETHAEDKFDEYP